MGYNTEFQGVLKFTRDLAAPELARLSKVFGEDRRGHPEWNVPDDCGFYHMDLRFDADYTGIEWDSDGEKTYGMQEMIEFVLRWMREISPDFGLVGTLLAQGEEFADCWRLVVDADGVATIKSPPAGTPIECPHCEYQFIPEERP